MTEETSKKPKERRTNTKLVREFAQKRCGVIMVYCVKTRKAYIARSTDVEWLIWYTKKKLRYGCYPKQEVQDDYNTHGLQWFRFGVAECFVPFDESKDVIERKIDDIWVEMYHNMHPAYNKENYKGHRFYLTRNLKSFGRTRIGMDTQKYRSAKNLRGLYAITCVQTKRQYIGFCDDFQKRMTVTLSALRGNYFFNPIMQEDWNLYGEDCFAIEFCEVEQGDLQQLRDEFIEQHHPYYTVHAEAERVRKISAHNRIRARQRRNSPLRIEHTRKKALRSPR